MGISSFALRWIHNFVDGDKQFEVLNFAPSIKELKGFVVKLLPPVEATP